MALAPVGSAADEADPVSQILARRAIPQQLARHPDDDALLDAIRRSLQPGDPVARLLAGWKVPPVRPVTPQTARRAPSG